jgi:hypothetical protein
MPLAVSLPLEGDAGSSQVSLAYRHVRSPGTSASARISKGQGYQDFLRKRAGSSLAKKGQFALYKEKMRKTDRISLLSGTIKCFSISFNTFKTL